LEIIIELQWLIGSIVQLVFMPNEKNKASLLSAQLDFERVDTPPVKSEALDFFDLDFDVDSRPDLLETYLPSPPLPENESKTSSAEVISSNSNAGNANTAASSSVVPELLKPKKLVTSVKKPNSTDKKNKDAKNDKFAFYAAIVALCGFLVVFAAIFYIRVIDNSGDTPSYLTLPETVANLDGQVIRIKITLQVEKKDRDWLASNKSTLMQVFPIVVTRINPDDLHTEQGFDLAREKLRNDFNQELKTDKIQSVLMDQLLTQTRE